MNTTYKIMIEGKGILFGEGKRTIKAIDLLDEKYTGCYQDINKPSMLSQCGW